MPQGLTRAPLTHDARAPTLTRSLPAKGGGTAGVSGAAVPQNSCGEGIRNVGNLTFLKWKSDGPVVPANHRAICTSAAAGRSRSAIV